MESYRHLVVLGISIFIAAVAVGWGLKDWYGHSYGWDSKLSSIAGSCCSGGSCSLEDREIHEGSGLNSLLGTICQTACGAQGYQDGEIVDPAFASVGAITKCPVSGAIFQVRKNSPIISIDGEDYYACCNACANLFSRSPGLFENAD